MSFNSANRLYKRMQHPGHDEPLEDPSPVPPEPPIQEPPPEHPEAPE